MHEILTVQIGNQANYVATHFWNTQDAYFLYDEPSTASGLADGGNRQRSNDLVDHDCHFRAGLNDRGQETYTPRTVIYDLKGGFGSLRQYGGVYEQGQPADENGSTSTWDGQTTQQHNQSISPSEYQQALDRDEAGAGDHLNVDSVRYWSDYSRIFYHPRSIVQIYDYELNSSLMPFEQYESGDELFDKLDREDDILDRDLRRWAEECDQMQGIQIMAGNDDGWAGFTGRYAERILDDLGKTSIWIWGIPDQKTPLESIPRAKRALKVLNQAKTIVQLASTASLYVPLSIPFQRIPPYLRMDHSSPWHTSALFSTAIETATIPCRMRDAPTRMDRLASDLNKTGQRIVAGLKMGVSRSQSDDDPKSVVQGQRQHQVNGDIYNVSKHGLCDINLRHSLGFTSLDSHGDEHIFDIVETHRGSTTNMTNGHASQPDHHQEYNIHSLYPLPDSFPRIFTNISGSEATVTVRAYTSSKLSSDIWQSKDQICRYAAVEERESLADELAGIADAYTEGWASDEDANSDD